MKNPKSISLAVLFISLIVFSSCRRNSGEATQVQGSVTVYNPDYPAIQHPLQGVMMYLLDAEVVEDMAGGAAGLDPCLDSVATDASGFYRFEGLDAGEYVVVPGQGEEDYAFIPADGDFQSAFFSVTGAGESLTIDFTAPEPVAENPEGTFSLTFSFTNYPTYSIVADDLGNRLILRRYWFKNISEQGVDTFVYDLDNTYKDRSFTVQFPYGYNYFFWGLYNTFTVSIEALGETLATFERAIDLPVSGCPPESNYEIDWKNYTFTRK